MSEAEALRRQLVAVTERWQKLYEERGESVARLEAENKRLRDATDAIHRDTLRNWAKDVERLEAENARLRDALVVVRDTGDGDKWIQRYAADILRAAALGTPDEPGAGGAQ